MVAVPRIIYVPIFLRDRWWVHSCYGPYWTQPLYLLLPTPPKNGKFYQFCLPFLSLHLLVECRSWVHHTILVRDIKVDRDNAYKRCLIYCKISKSIEHKTSCEWLNKVVLFKMLGDSDTWVCESSSSMTHLNSQIPLTLDTLIRRYLSISITVTTCP